MKIKGLIYDLDGTIILTIALHDQGWRLAGKQLGIPVTDEMVKMQWGIPEPQAAPMMLGLEKPNELSDEYARRKIRYVVDHANEATMFPCFTKTHKLLLEKNIQVWICTSAGEDFSTAVFNGLPELALFGNKTVWAGMYKNGKPSPEPLLLTAQKMGNLNPSDCIYVGDANSDRKSAKAAGMGFVCFLPGAKEAGNIMPIATLGIQNHSEILNFV